MNLRSLFSGKSIPAAPLAPASTPGVSTIMRHEPPSYLRTLTGPQLHGILEMAERGHTRELFGLYRECLFDAHIQAEVNKRKLAVLGDAWRIDSAMPGDAQADAARDTIAAELPHIAGLDAALAHLLDGALWPVAVCELRYAWGKRELEAPATVVGASSSQSSWRIAEILTTPATFLSWPEGVLSLETTPRMFTPIAPGRFIVHRGNCLGAPDWWGGPFRAVLFWWLFATLDAGWWAKAVERHNAPFFVGTYRQGDATSRNLLESAFSLAARLGGLVVEEGTQVQIKESLTTGSGENFARLLDTCQREISKLVVGQTLSSTPESTGMGSGVANLHGQVRDDIRQYDAATLGKTLRTQLFVPMLKLAGLPDPERYAPHIVWRGREEAAELAGHRQSLASLLPALASAGLAPAEDALPEISRQVGFTVVQAASPTGLTSPTSLTAPPTCQCCQPRTVIAFSAASPLARLIAGTDAALLGSIQDAPTPQAALAALGKIPPPTSASVRDVAREITSATETA